MEGFSHSGHLGWLIGGSVGPQLGVADRTRVLDGFRQSHRVGSAGDLTRDGSAGDLSGELPRLTEAYRRLMDVY